MIAPVPWLLPAAQVWAVRARRRSQLCGFQQDCARMDQYAGIPRMPNHQPPPSPVRATTSFARSTKERPRPGSPSRNASFTRSARSASFTRSSREKPGSPRRTTTSAPTSPVGSPRTDVQSAALRAYELGEPVLSAWLDPVAPAASSHGTTDKDLVQRHSEKCKQLRVAHAARNELELQIAQLHALGPQAVWRQRAAAAAAAAAATATAAAAAATATAEVARLREECQQWSQHWQGLRTLLQAGQLEALRRALDAPPSDVSAAHPPPKTALGSTATLPTAPATAGALAARAARVRPEAPQPHASRAACIACRVRVPTVPVLYGVRRTTPCTPQVVIGVEAEVTPARMQPVLASWCGKAATIEEGGLSLEAELSDAGSPYPMQSHHLELPRSIVEARSGGEAPADEAKPTATSMASDPPERSSAQTAGAHKPTAPAAEAAIPIAPSPKTTAAGVVVPALNVGKTDDFLSRLAAAESGERGSSSR